MTGAVREWRSGEAKVFWRYIASSFERFVGVAEELDVVGLHWRPPAPEANSVAVVLVHMMANVSENILTVLGGEPAERVRDDEFEDSTLTAAELHQQWTRLRGRLEGVLSAVSSGQLDATVVHPRRGSITGREVLLVVARHVAEHLGQAELTRDLWRATPSS